MFEGVEFCIVNGCPGQKTKAELEKAVVEVQKSLPDFIYFNMYSSMVRVLSKLPVLIPVTS